MFVLLLPINKNSHAEMIKLVPNEVALSFVALFFALHNR